MKPLHKQAGYVYCLHDAENSMCRIGRTINEDMSRQKSQIGYYAFHLDVTTVAVPNSTFCEKFVHKAFNDYRKKADWFNITPEMFNEQIQLAIKDFNDKYEKFKAIESAEGYLKTPKSQQNYFTPPTTNYRTRYKCNHCDKNLCDINKIVEHMKICADNPKNKDACFGCLHCKTVYKTAKDQNGKFLSNLYGFHCDKLDKKMYSHKARAWGLNTKYPNSFKGEELMPTECANFDDGAIIEQVNYRVKVEKEEYVPRLDWDAYDRIEITTTTTTKKP